MKKSTLIAAAVAASFSGSLLAEVTTSGIVQAQYRMGDASDTVAAGDVRFNIASSDDLGNGKVAYSNMRIDADGLASTGITVDAVKVGVKGSFGDVALGDVGNTATGLTEFAGDFIDTTTVNKSVAYKNKAGDLTFAVTMSPDGQDDGTTFGAQFAMGNLTFGAAAGSQDGGDTSLVGVKAKFGDITLGLQTGDVEDDARMNIKVAWANGPLSADFTSNDRTDADDGAVTVINVTYSLGGGTSVGFRNYTAGDDATATSAGGAADYSRVILSKKF